MVGLRESGTALLTLIPDSDNADVGTWKKCFLRRRVFSTAFLFLKTLFPFRLKERKDKMLKTKTLKLTESAVMLALATILSFLAVVRMPFGGDVTAVSMLPVLVVAFRYGTPWGLLTGFTYSLIQMLLGLNNLQYATSAAAVVAIILLDYIVAFSVCGFGGLFSKKIKDPTLALPLGAVIACALRFICHVISGCTVWAGVSIPDVAGLTYSLSYNSAYMIPETILTVIGAYTMAEVFDLKSSPMKRRLYSGKVGIWGLLAISLAVMIDSVVLFKSIQTADGYNIKNIVNANWLLIGIVTLIAVVITLINVAVRKKR